MENKKVLFFDIKSYDKEFFNKYGKDYNIEMNFLKGKLTEETAPLTKGYEIVCAFANDTINKKVIDIQIDGEHYNLKTNNINISIIKNGLEIII